MKVTISRFSIGDREVLIDQVLSLNRLENSFAQDRATDRDAAMAYLDVALARALETDGAAVVAELDQEILGYLILIFRQSEGYIRDELRTHGYICDLFVRDDARNLGVGKALVEEAEQIARHRKASRLVIGVLASNFQAIGFYRSSGFVDYSIDMEKRFSH